MFIDWQKAQTIFSILSLVFMGWLAYREFWLKKQKVPSEKDQNITSAVKNLAEALKLSSDELVERLTDAAKLRGELDAEKLATKNRIAETKKHREEQDAKIAELEQHIDKLNRDYAKETSKLQQENEALTLQVQALSIKYGEIDQKYSNAKQVIEKLVKALHDAHIPVPDFNGNLTDSISNWKWPTDQTPPKK